MNIIQLKRKNIKNDHCDEINDDKKDMFQRISRNKKITVEIKTK
jgi:hypothetical protein